jgi:hypothetical protein
VARQVTKDKKAGLGATGLDEEVGKIKGDPHMVETVEKTSD